MKKSTWICLLFWGCLSLMPAGPARAAINCSVNASSVSVFFSYALNLLGLSLIGNTTDADGSVNLTCTRLSTDPTSITYRILIDNGNYPFLFISQARSSLNTLSYLPYEIYRDPARILTWDAPATGSLGAVTGTLNFAAGSTSASTNIPYYFRVPGGLLGTTPTGVYTDLPKVTVVYPNADTGTRSAPSAFQVNIGTNSTCYVAQPPNDINLSYLSRQLTPAVATTSVTTACSLGVAYSVSVSPSTGTLLGVNYSLSIDGLSGGVGTGLAIPYTVRATAAAGQSGNCSLGVCTASAPHTFLISY